MFGYTIIKKEELDHLQSKSRAYVRALSYSCWPHQTFVCRFFKSILEANPCSLDGLSNARDQFNSDLAEYVAHGGKESDECRKRSVEAIHWPRHDILRLAMERIPK